MPRTQRRARPSLYLLSAVSWETPLSFISLQSERRRGSEEQRARKSRHALFQQGGETIKDEQKAQRGTQQSFLRSMFLKMTTGARYQVGPWTEEANVCLEGKKKLGQ